MNTEELIKLLRSIMPVGPLTKEIHKAAADTLEELQKKCSMHYQTICELTKERNEARSEVERLKDTVAAYEEATVKQSLTVRPEPSRLEIAAQLLAAVSSRRDLIEWETKEEAACAVEQADTLIAAAREAK
jgi:hypothetical protein